MGCKVSVECTLVKLPVNRLLLFKGEETGRMTRARGVGISSSVVFFPIENLALICSFFSKLGACIGMMVADGLGLFVLVSIEIGNESRGVFNFISAGTALNGSSSKLGRIDLLFTTFSIELKSLASQLLVDVFFLFDSCSSCIDPSSLEEDTFIYIKLD